VPTALLGQSALRELQQDWAFGAYWHQMALLKDANGEGAAGLLFSTRKTLLVVPKRLCSLNGVPRGPNPGTQVLLAEALRSRIL
jgi:hypothetical protein